MFSTMPRKYYQVATQAFLIVLFAVSVFRAFTQSIVHDEALTWQWYILAPVSQIFKVFSPNHHFLYTILARLSTAMFGVSEWALRLPALVSAALYFFACYRFTRAAFGDGFTMLLSVCLLTLNPLVLDFMVAARGYGMALALWMLSAALLLEESMHPRSTRYTMLAGAALALSVTANLVFVLPAAALAAIAAFLILRRREVAAPLAAEPAKNTKHAKRKKKKAAVPTPQHTGSRLGPVVVFAIPIVVIAFLFLTLAPIEGIRAEDLYTGAAGIGGSLRSLGASSFEHSGPLRNQHWLHGWTNVVAFGIAPLVLAAAMVWGILRRNLVLIVPSGAAVFSAICLLFIHMLFDRPYPADRTGIYFLAVAALSLAGLAYEWRNAHGPIRAASIGAYILAVIFVLQYATEFNTRKFLVWEYDADTRAIADRLATDRSQNAAVTRIGGSWQLQPVLRFYTYVRNWTWAELTEGPPAAGLDYYALLAWERDTVEGNLGLKEIYRGPVSGSVLAKPK